MLTVQKVIGADDCRPSRLHTRRGERLPLRTLLGLPRLMAVRVAGRPPTMPWMTRGAVTALEARLTPNMTLLELGSGASTRWYARRVQSVASIEPDVQWFLTTHQAISDCANVVLRQQSVASYLSTMDTTFDVAIIDHRDEPGASRMDALRVAARSCGLIVLDDSDRAEYRGAAEELGDAWIAERFVGFSGPTPLRASETTLFTRR